MTVKASDLNLPWSLEDYGKRVYRVVDSRKTEFEYVFHNEAYYPDAPELPVAAYIVKAVNNHEALVAMVREFVDHVRDEDDPLDIKHDAKKLLASLD